MAKTHGKIDQTPDSIIVSNRYDGGGTGGGKYNKRIF